jgi:hypothetical protein
MNTNTTNTMGQDTTESIITSETQYIDKLADISASVGKTNFDILTDGTKETLELKEKELYNFLNTNTDFANYSETVRDEMFDSAIKLWNEYKDLVKNAPCSFKCNGLEVKTIDKKLHQSIDYTTESLFYGMHLKKHFVDTLPKVKSEYEMHNDIIITFSNAIALYHIMSTLTVRGLNKENYALAHVLYKLSEISKVYQFFDNVSARLDKAIREWNMGLTKTDADALNSAIAKTVIAEKLAEVEAEKA